MPTPTRSTKQPDGGGNIIRCVVDLLDFLPRLQGTRLGRVLTESPVVVLVGARQTGKTTLVQSSGIGSSRTYTSLDDLAALETAVRDPEALLMGAEPIKNSITASSA
jgi:hypothetical protein